MTDYDIFHQLNQEAKPFILANAWNAKSAKLIEEAGYPAIGTSSGAIAESLGYPDGEKIPFDTMLRVLERIKAATSLPLSVDFERGYTDDPDMLTANVQKLLDLGASGINIEDTQGEEIYLRKLSRIRNYLEKTNQQLFINARTDVFLQRLERPTETVIRRAERYREAGADGLFVTGIRDVKTLKTITSSTDLPVNVVAVPTLASLETLGNCGVRRVSMAVFLYKAVYQHASDILREIRSSDGLDALYR